MFRPLSVLPGAALLFLSLGAVPVCAASSSEVLGLHTQQVGSTTYFRVSLAGPALLSMPTLKEIEAPVRKGAPSAPTPPIPSEELRVRLGRLPRLASLDGRTRDIYFEGLRKDKEKGARLEFIGKVDGKERCDLLLVYPTEEAAPRKTRSLAPSLLRYGWRERSLRIDFSKTEAVAVPRGERHDTPAHGDLEGCWAAARARSYALRAVQTPDFGFYGLARQLVGRKYRVSIPPLSVLPAIAPERVRQSLYETTTGAAALTESLALRRLLQGPAGKPEERTRSIDSLPGITIAEHPWEKMMAGKKPADEPLARMVPHDQYYLTFTNLAKLIELGELLDEWGTNVLYGYELTSRDSRLRQRYEKQLCLKSTALAKKLGPLVVRSVAITGSAPYFREGTDVSIIFDVVNRPVFLAALQPLLDEARAKYGDDLHTRKEDYRGVKIESFTTARREVSLYRAWVGDRIIYSNSPVALRRILDTEAGRRKALVDSGDFRYMRTVFVRGAREEDGFAFLPDAFIRTLVGPASKIKEKRRLEALTSLTMMTHGALYAACETGRMPGDRAALLDASGLKASEVAIADEEDAAWDGKARVAVSDVYNTIHFATPLIELPIDKVTEQEALEYGEFRREYTTLWRRYFDPVGIRIGLSGEQVRVETYILPLIQSSSYNDLRRMIGGGTTTRDQPLRSSRTLLQYLTHVNLASQTFLKNWGVGDWFVIRLADGPQYRRLAQSLVRRQLEGPKTNRPPDEEAAALLRLPLTLGVHVKDKDAFNKLLPLIKLYLLGGDDDDSRVLSPYKGVTVKCIRSGKDSDITDWMGYAPTFYHAHIAGAWYVSTQADAIRDLIDHAAAPRDGKEREEVNSSLSLAPEEVFHASATLHAYLEWETFRRAVGNVPVWQALQEAKLVKDLASDEAQETAYQMLGFVPVSPDGSRYARNSRTGEVLNVRHGSHGRPKLNDGLAEKAPVRRLLDQLTTVRADLRFREDGVHTVLTLRRRTSK